MATDKHQTRNTDGPLVSMVVAGETVWYNATPFETITHVPAAQAAKDERSK